MDTPRPPLPKTISRYAIWEHPVILKELRGRMRDWRAFALLTAYLVLLSLGVGSIFWGYAFIGAPFISATTRITLGRVIFGLITGLELLMICFTAPALTAGAIASEREQQTYDLLRATPLSARAIVLGKLSSALAFIFLLLFAALPLQSLAFWIGGVLTSEVILAILLLAVIALAFCAVGLFFSSLLKRTLVATVLSYVFVGLTVFGLPVLIGVLMGVLTVISAGDARTITPPQMAILLSVGWILVALNPIATAIATEIVLIQEHSLYSISIPLENGISFPFLSPWIGSLIFYLLFSVVLIMFSIRLIKRRDRE